MARVYIAGPMSGYPGHNFDLFNAAAAQLRALGHDVLNPVDINPDPGTPWNECMRKDIEALMTCGTVALLPGWEASRGACLEVHIAKEFRLNVVPFVILFQAGSAA